MSAADSRRRNLTTILRRARLSRAERRSHGIQRRQELTRHAECQRVRGLLAESLARAAETHLTHPFGASTTSRSSLEELSQDTACSRGLTRAHTPIAEIATAQQTSTTGTEKKALANGEEIRWAVYNEVKAIRFSRTDDEWEPFVSSLSRRAQQLLEWPQERPCPRWRLIEAWAAAAHGPLMAVAGGRRLALWRDDAEHHGRRLERAFERYVRYADARPPGWATVPAAAFALFLAAHTRRQDGAEHGMAYDVQRFNKLTKQMSAYAHYTREQHLELAASRARRRERARQLAAQLNQRFQFRRSAGNGAPRLRLASDLLASDHPAHQAAGRTLYAQAKRVGQLAERDERMLAGEHPGNADGRYRAACAYAERWGLPAPLGGSRERL